MEIHPVQRSKCANRAVVGSFAATAWRICALNPIAPPNALTKLARFLSNVQRAMQTPHAHRVEIFPELRGDGRGVGAGVVPAALLQEVGGTRRSMRPTKPPSTTFERSAVRQPKWQRMGS
jgi:hypothetical protein